MKFWNISWVISSERSWDFSLLIFSKLSFLSFCYCDYLGDTFTLLFSKGYREVVKSSHWYLPLCCYLIFYTFAKSHVTGKSVSEALILESVNPQYDDWLFIDSRLQYKKNTSSEHVVYKNCFECQKNKQKTILCTQHVLSLYFSCTEVRNQWTICHIVG